MGNSKAGDWALSVPEPSEKSANDNARPEDSAMFYILILRLLRSATEKGVSQ